MSLNDAPFGFRAIRTLNGGDIRTGEYTVSSATNRIFRGDVVDLENSTGLVVRRANSSVEQVLGVAAEEFNQSGTAGVKIKIYDDPSTVFEAMVSNTAAINQAFFGSPRRIETAAGDSDLGYSKQKVGTATASSATYVVKPVRLSPKEENDLTQNSVIECVLAGDPTEAPRA